MLHFKCIQVIIGAVALIGRYLSRRTREETQGSWQQSVVLNHPAKDEDNPVSVIFSNIYITPYYYIIFFLNIFI